MVAEDNFIADMAGTVGKGCEANAALKAVALSPGPRDFPNDEPGAIVLIFPVIEQDERIPFLEFSD